MTHPTPSRNSEIRTLRANVKQLREALKLLFDLLEAYAPMWYQEEYREKARTALGDYTSSTPRGRKRKPVRRGSRR